jgi:hypothetical protein
VSTKLLLRFNVYMTTLRETLKSRMDSTGMTAYSVFKAGDIPQMSLRDFLSGKLPPSDTVLNGLARIPALGFTLEELYARRLLDEYPPDVVAKAMEILKDGCNSEV